MAVLEVVGGVDEVMGFRKDGVSNHHPRDGDECVVKAEKMESRPTERFTKNANWLEGTRNIEFEDSSMKRFKSKVMVDMDGIVRTYERGYLDSEAWKRVVKKDFPGGITEEFAAQTKSWVDSYREGMAQFGEGEKNRAARAASPITQRPYKQENMGVGVGG